jgi:hypothetical protein
MSTMEIPDFIVFTGSKEQRYGLIIEKYVTQHTRFNYKNQKTY